MNALVAVNNDTSGIRSLSKAQRAEVAQQLKSLAATPENAFARELAAIQQKVGLATSSETASTKSAATTNTSANATKAKGTDDTVTTKSADSSSSSTNTSTRDVSGTLDKNDFLNLMVLQLQNQDPTEPTDNSQMIAQLAQFSALEQMTNLNTSFEELSTRVDQLNFVSAGSLVGKTATGLTAAGATVEGTIDRVSLADGVVTLTINGSDVTIDKVQRIG